MRGTRQGRTIELRLEGRLLCSRSGLLGGEVSLGRAELSFLPLTHLGPQPSDRTAHGPRTISRSCAGGGAAGQRRHQHLPQGGEEMRAL